MGFPLLVICNHCIESGLLWLWELGIQLYTLLKPTKTCWTVHNPHSESGWPATSNRMEWMATVSPHERFSRLALQMVWLSAFHERAFNSSRSKLPQQRTWHFKKISLQCISDEFLSVRYLPVRGHYLEENPQRNHLWPFSAQQWCHNERDDISNHLHFDCLLKNLFRHRSKKTSKLRVIGLCEGIHQWPVDSPRKGPVTQKMFPFDDIIMKLLFVICSLS